MFIRSFRAGPWCDRRLHAVGEDAGVMARALEVLHDPGDVAQGVLLSLPALGSARCKS